MKTPDEVRIIDPENDIEYDFFDQDPDEDEMRAGDGWYFRVIGEEGWNGPWETEEEAKDEMYDALEYEQWQEATTAIKVAGFQLIEKDGFRTTFIRKQADGEPYFIDISPRKASIRVGSDGVIRAFEFPAEGYNHIVKAALEMAQIAGPAPSVDLAPEI